MELVGLALFIGSYIVQLGHEGLIPELVDKFRLPKKHDVLLVASCFLLLDGLDQWFGTYNLGGVHFSVLYLLQLVDFTK